jgi:flagellin-like hook-associated protein FlgL
MSINSVTNSFSVQSNLSALTQTQNFLQQIEQQLATGKTVNSASDNAVVYTQSQNLLQQANDLSNLKNNLSNSLVTVNSATNSISSSSQVVQQLQGIVSQAAATTDPTTRANLAAQYNSLLPQLDSLANDSTFNGTNLLNGSGNLVVNFNASNTASLTIPGVNVTSSGLNITGASNGFGSAADINSANAQLQAAQSTLSTDASSFGNNATLIQTNQDFSSNLITNLTTASNNLVVADTNEEGASLLAAQAQNQLGIISLGISAQASQDILKLFP